MEAAISKREAKAYIGILEILGNNSGMKEFKTSFLCNKTKRGRNNNNREKYKRTNNNDNTNIRTHRIK